jgi:hypothetical protein
MDVGEWVYILLNGDRIGFAAIVPGIGKGMGIGADGAAALKNLFTSGTMPGNKALSFSPEPSISEFPSEYDFWGGEEE